jgi:hypothetical protein
MLAPAWTSQQSWPLWQHVEPQHVDAGLQGFAVLQAGLPQVP